MGEKLLTWLRDAWETVLGMVFHVAFAGIAVLAFVIAPERWRLLEGVGFSLAMVLVGYAQAAQVSPAAPPFSKGQDSGSTLSNILARAEASAARSERMASYLWTWTLYAIFGCGLIWAALTQRAFWTEAPTALLLGAGAFTLVHFGARAADLAIVAARQRVGSWVESMRSSRGSPQI